MSQQRNDEGFRHANPNPQGDWGESQGGGQHGGQFTTGQSGGQAGGQQSQYSQYQAPNGPQYGGQRGGQYERQPGGQYGGQYGGNPDRPYTPGNPAPLYNQGQERQWGPSQQQGRYPGGGQFQDERQFSGHYGATDDPYRTGQGASGWTPPQSSEGSYGRRGFGGTGHGGAGYAGLGAFQVEQQDNHGFNPQQFDQFGREQLERQWAEQGSGQGSRRPHRDPHYQQWREEQLRRFDDDYEQWHQERFQKFSDDFNDWRARRQEPVPGNAAIRASGGAAAGSEGGDLGATSEPRTHKPENGQPSGTKGGK